MQFYYFIFTWKEAKTEAALVKLRVQAVTAPASELRGWGGKWSFGARARFFIIIICGKCPMRTSKLGLSEVALQKSTVLA